MKKTFVLKVNGQTHTLEADADTPLLYVLRNQLQLNGPKYGCGMQQCGACMVLINGVAQPSCMMAVSSADKSEITTIEGLEKQKGKLHAVQEAFVTEQAAQCGYCLNGMVISAVALLQEIQSPDDEQIRIALDRSLCRCGSHARILRAVKRAAKT
jgi:nicotinate dehydrogenase subunit A